MINQTPNWHWTVNQLYFWLGLAKLCYASSSVDGLFGIILCAYFAYRIWIDRMMIDSKVDPCKVSNVEPERNCPKTVKFHQELRYIVYYSSAIALMLIGWNALWFPAQIVVFATYFLHSDFKARRTGGNALNRKVAFLWMATDYVILAQGM